VACARRAACLDVSTLADVTTVQRINSHGGAAQGACDQAGAFRSVPYSADYVFLSAHK
jgi:hypothetical protein